MKKLIALLLVSALTFGLVGCSEGNNTGGATAVGALAGGLLGSQFGGGSGQVAAAIGGAVLGGYVGNQVGQYMDRQDRMNMQSAIINTPVGQQASWTNSESNVTYQVRPTRNYHKGSSYCREYQTRVQIKGQWKNAYGRACRQPDGSWKIVS